MTLRSCTAVPVHTPYMWQARPLLSGKAVTGLNGIPPAIAAVNRGFMDLTVNVSPFAFGNVGVDTMVAHLKGKAFSKKVTVGFILVDKNNAKKFIRKKKKK